MATSRTIHLASATSAYSITIGRGLLATLYPRLQKISGRKTPRTFLITNETIWKLWSTKVRSSFPEAQNPKVLFVPAGEKYKRLTSVEKLAEQLAEAGADRDSLLLGFGGGVIGDMTGFLAAIYMRGIPYVHLPTTVLAQVDSSVGGKTGVNLAAGKNLLGSFNQPLAVIADIDLLSTLPANELRAGLQEAIKAGIIASPSLFLYIEKHKNQLLSGDPATLTRVVAAAVQVKADIVAQDEKEAGLRMILNFGHTLGHAIEAATSFKTLLHGEAIAWGALAALHLSLSRKSISAHDFARIANLILTFGPLPPFRAKPAALVALTASDKKTRSGRRAFILVSAVGKAEVVYDVTDEELLHAAEAMMADMQRLSHRGQG